MAANFLVRPEKLIAKRSLIDANKTTASTTWVAVPGTRTKFTLGADSLLEFLIQGVLTTSGGAGRVDLDVAIDGRLIGYDALPTAGVPGPNGSTNGLISSSVAAAAALAAFELADILDSAGLGEHSFELFFKVSANTAVLEASAATNPLKYTIIEHASAYPPNQQAAY